MRDDEVTLSEEQLEHLAQYFNEEVMPTRNYKPA